MGAGRGAGRGAALTRRPTADCLADKLAPKLGATRKAAGDHIELVGPKGKVVVGSNLAAVERDVASGAISPARMVVYFTGQQGGMSNQHEATMKAAVSGAGASRRLAAPEHEGPGSPSGSPVACGARR